MEGATAQSLSHGEGHAGHACTNMHKSDIFTHAWHRARQRDLAICDSRNAPCLGAVRESCLVRSGTYRDVARPLRVTPSSTFSRPRMALVPPAHGGAALAAPPPVLVAPTIAHNFIRCYLVGADNTLDYLYTPGGAKIVSAFPTLGWLDASSLSPGAKAAPCLAIAAVTIPAAHGDWDGAVLQPLLALSELEAAFELIALSRFADALASLGVLDRAYLDRRAFLDAWEVALARAPSPSPFEILAGEIAVLSPFAPAGRPAVPGRAAIPAVAAVAPVVGIRASRGPPPVVAVRAVRGVAAVLPVPAVLAAAAVAASPGPPELQWWSYVTVGHSVDRLGPFPEADTVADAPLGHQAAGGGKRNVRGRRATSGKAVAKGEKSFS